MRDIKRQIILGTLMGNAFIANPKKGNCCLTVPENKDLNWLKYKATQIVGYFKSPYHDGKRWIWKSPCDQYWNETYEEFYDDEGKCITMDILDSFTGDALATWFLDKGYFVSGKRIGLRTTGFGMKGNQVIKQYFDEVGMPCQIRKERTTGRIIFTHDGTKEFLKVIHSQYIPDFMLYRLEP